MKEIGAYEAKTKLSRILEQVRRGQSFQITHHGQPVAHLIPVAPRRDPKASIEAIRRFRKGKRLDGSVRELIVEGRRR